MYLLFLAYEKPLRWSYMNTLPPNITPPAILAPAGNKASFLAALSAGADAIYCGLKDFSARMEAENFSIDDLSPLTQLAHERGSEVYIALNALLKPDDLNKTEKLLKELKERIHPDALIIQDLSLIQLIRQIGFSVSLHLSTLTHVSFPSALKLIGENLNIDRVVLPRELSIDEIKDMAEACPGNLNLEVFVHGAICYGVSGRCYWSSYLGGKSGLRGRCVQPCRRMYTQSTGAKRYFSCQDLSLDVLSKVLLEIPKIRAWKIEGRKKGPHYVYHTVKAYRTLRDGSINSEDWALAKKEAIELLSLSLGRIGSHYHFLSQRPQNPISTQSQTGSGFIMGRVRGTSLKPYFKPQKALLPGDILRIGYEDEPWHSIFKIKQHVPKNGNMNLPTFSGKTYGKETPVFLIDRRENALEQMMSDLEKRLNPSKETPTEVSFSKISFPRRTQKRVMAFEQKVFRQVGQYPVNNSTGIWLSDATCKQVNRSISSRLWWWLPPVIWPDGEKPLRSLLDEVLKKNGRNFVLNAPWQIALFKTIAGMNIWAGPFCNVTNGLAVQSLCSMGFGGVIVSPELDHKAFMALPGQSPLPLGVVLSGNFPLCISRIVCDEIQPEQLFTSPKGEQAWVKKYESNFWVYPNWKLDLKAHKGELQKVGYTFFVHLMEPIPTGVRLKKREGSWNWDLSFL